MFLFKVNRKEEIQQSIRIHVSCIVRFSIIITLTLQLRFLTHVGAPLQEIKTYYDLFPVDKGQPKMVDFAKKKIPGFDLLMGFGYYESNPKEHIKPSSKIILKVMENINFNVYNCVTINIINCRLKKMRNFTVVLVHTTVLLDCVLQVLQIQEPNELEQHVNHANIGKYLSRAHRLNKRFCVALSFCIVNINGSRPSC